MREMHLQQSRRTQYIEVLPGVSLLKALPEIRRHYITAARAHTSETIYSIPLTGTQNVGGVERRAYFLWDILSVRDQRTRLQLGYKFKFTV